jgi:hypothetical protein
MVKRYTKHDLNVLYRIVDGMEEWLRKYGVETLDWDDDVNNMLRYFYYRLSYVYDFIEYMYDNYEYGYLTYNFLTKDDVGLLFDGRVNPIEMTCDELTNNRNVEMFLERND